MEDKPEKGIAIPLQVLKMFKDIKEVLPFEITNYPARALRALGLLLADGAPTPQCGGGRLFDGSTIINNFFYENCCNSRTESRKSIPRWEINRHG